ncbi:ABC transporter ATP-binding protein/permease [bacterium]|nr:ABC transporter ATP-binding protein/permease [bacterium]
MEQPRPVLTQFWSAARRYLWHYRGATAVVVFSSILASLLETTLPLLLGLLIDLLNGEASELLVFLRGLGASEPQSTALWLLPTTMGAGMLLAAIFSFLSLYSAAKVGQSLTAKLRMASIRQLLRVPFADFISTKPGELLTRIQENSREVGGAVMSLREMIKAFLVLLVVGTLVITRHWRLALFLAVLIPVIGGAVVLVNRFARRYARRVTEASAEIYNYAGERLAGIELVTAFGAAERESASFAKLAWRYYRNRVKGEVVKSGFRGIVELLAGLALIAILIYGGSLVNDGVMTTGGLLEFLALVATVFEPIKTLSRARLNLSPAGISMGRVNMLLDWQPGTALLGSPPKGKLKLLPTMEFLTERAEPAAAANAIPEIDGELRFSEVHYSIGESEILKGISFTAEAGKTTALVGVSGAGKSTIINLALGLLSPEAGAVLLDGEPLKNYDQRALKRLCAPVPQEVTLTTGSVAENLRLSAESADDAALWQALEVAQLAEVVRSLPDGLDSDVGEAGRLLSGGEGQRLAIARAILRQPSLLFLDEPTASLDADNEARVVAALEPLLEGRTVVVVAHRLATVRQADKIVVMEDGLVIEEGTHDELLTLNGRYADLARLQLGDAD